MQNDWNWSLISPPAGSPQPSPRCWSAMVTVQDHFLLLFGGLGPSDQRLEDAWLFDLRT